MLKVSRRYYLEHLAVLLVVAILTALVLRSGLMMPLSRYVYDNMQPILPNADFSDIAIVSIDDESLEHIGSWPWSREVHAQIIENLTAYGTQAVVLDLIFSEPDTMRPESDAALMRALDKNGNVFLPVNLMADNFGGVLETMPHAFFAQTSAGMGHVNAQLDVDGVVRGIYMRTGIGQPSWRHIALAVFNQLNPRGNELYRIRAEDPSPELSLEQRYYRMIPFVDTSLVPHISAAEIFEGTADPELLKDKVVFVGATASGLSDTLPIPLRSNRGRITGVEMNATIYAALQDQMLIKRISTFWHWALSLTLACITIFLLPLLAPRWAIPLVFLMLMVTISLSYALLAWYQTWFPTGAAIAGIIIAYPLWTWRRLEYSLGQLRRTLQWLSVHDDLNQRLIQSAPLASALTLLEKIMPMEAWRLRDKNNKRTLITSRNKIDPKKWNSRQTRFYPFFYDQAHLELQVIWQEDAPTASQEQWINATLSRCEDSAEPTADHSFDFLETQIGRIRTQEQRQQALTHFFEVSLAQLREGVVIADATGQLLFLNTQASQWLGIPANNIQSYHLLDMDRELVYNQETNNWRTIISQAISTGRSQLECQTQSGRDLYLDVLRTRAGRQPGEILLLTFKDVTEVKQAMRTKSEMLDFLSHDLRSPMLSLLALAERYQSEHENDTSMQEFTTHIRKYAQRSLNIAEQFLQLARAEATQSVDFSPVDMLAVVESAIEQSLVRAQQKQQHIQFDYDLEDNVWVNGHYELLVRAVENLLSNAIKYSPEGTQITVTLRGKDAQVICAVKDEGHGIEPEFIDHLFERFSRAKNESQNCNPGAGLGLRFVQVVTQRHQGCINVESELGKGSRFEISLPSIEM